MSTKTLFALSTSALLMAIAMPSAALAQFAAGAPQACARAGQEAQDRQGAHS